MKLHILSDLHIEFETFQPPATDADIIVLAGDIAPGLAAIEFARDQCHDKPVIFVAGNHEYYRHAIPKLTDAMREAAADTNVNFLEEGEVNLHGVRFLGATLWTDWEFNGADAVDQSMEIARQSMADYHVIRKSPEYGKLTPRTTLAFHRRARAWLRDKLDEPFAGKTVVVTHHAPADPSCADRYRGDGLTPAFISRLEDLVSLTTLWVHGHTHHSVDYAVGAARVVSNQRGYPGEASTGFVADRVVEI